VYKKLQCSGIKFYRINQSWRLVLRIDMCFPNFCCYQIDF